MPLSSLFLMLIYLLGGISSEETSIYRNGFGTLCREAVQNCLYNKCLQKSSNTFLCVECESGFVPINGKCVSTTIETVQKAGCVTLSASGWCTKCGQDYFLFYGGCYEWTGDWKISICDRAENGVCKDCGKGSITSRALVFTNPNMGSPERCIYCGDTIGFGGYSGISGCLFCTPSRLKQSTVADCYACLDQQNTCPYDHQCRRVNEGAQRGTCGYCLETHLWSAYSCYAINTPAGNNICLPKNVMKMYKRSLCTHCTNSSEVPYNGLCVPEAGYRNICTKNPNTGVCTKCSDRGRTQHYLFYGGCYIHILDPICQKVENNVCVQCKSDNQEVFTKENGCWRCGDTQHGGIEGCQRCEMKDETLQCLECNDLYLSLDKKNCLEKCPDGQIGTFSPSTSIHTCTCDNGFYLEDENCIKCVIDNCAKCDKSACNECMYGYALFNNQCKETRCQDPNCEICESKTLCIKCISTHSLDQNGLCVKDCLSSAGYYKDIVGGVSRCVKCTLDGCATCESADKCKTCKNEFYLESQEGCKPCSSECATCSSSTTGDCTSCPAKRRLQYSDDTKGSCVSQCVKDNSCAECGLTIDGTSYCSQCVKSTEYPRNGVCTSTNSRATGITCTTVVDGQCIVCGSSSFRLNGGCYTSTLLPGKAVCTTESNGWCDSTVAGYGITYNGTLRTCPENCKVCTDGSCSSCNRGFYPENGVCNACPEGCATCPHGRACFDCLAGYYFSENICKACHKAIPNCNLCMVPEDAVSPVCLDHSNTPRKSALSAKAISGIAIGAVVVVGTVAAVLVWLFVFRKKN
ncbi:High cysteine membrane VSP-like protein [Giardia lamblia P15]|uniref:High cysteine membrane VSP-like protein n=1 Tax=Giardia intestinalis (strain P15) TaxID=658858 RepID=E1F326_GIAIA|nr:High cysteine membrane VSP-like protein [Giardia lamblia P15]